LSREESHIRTKIQNGGWASPKGKGGFKPTSQDEIRSRNLEKKLVIFEQWGK